MENFKVTIEVKAPEIADAIKAFALAISNRSEAFKVLGVKGNTLKPQNTQDEKKEVTQPNEPTPKKEPVKEPEPQKEPETTYTLVQVREKLATLSRAGKQAKVKELITKYGGSKLSEVKKENYADLMAEAETIE